MTNEELEKLNEPACPFQYWDASTSLGPFPRSDGFSPGMSIRDYFAAKAMEARLSISHYHREDLIIAEKNGLNWMDIMSHFSYEIADAMLKERNI